MIRQHSLRGFSVSSGSLPASHLRHFEQLTQRVARDILARSRQTERRAHVSPNVKSIQQPEVSNKMDVSGRRKQQQPCRLGSSLGQSSSVSISVIANCEAATECIQSMINTVNKSLQFETFLEVCGAPNGPDWKTSFIYCFLVKHPDPKVSGN